MPATARDLAVAQAFAGRIVAAGQGRVRRVVMVGSRALGTARPDSDLDLVVLVELPPGARAWRISDCATERDRLQRVVGRPPLETDLWVRTTDQYEEARSVAGSVESLVDSEGVDVYARPFERAPRVRRTPAQVRREYTSGWITHALRALEAAGARDSAGTHERLAAARAAVERALHALLVSHGIRASKSGGAPAMLTSLDAVDPATASAVRSLLEAKADDPPAHTAAEVVKLVVARVGHDPALATQQNRAQARLSK